MITLVSTLVSKLYLSIENCPVSFRVQGDYNCGMSVLVLCYYNVIILHVRNLVVMNLPFSDCGSV